MSKVVAVLFFLLGCSADTSPDDQAFALEHDSHGWPRPEDAGPGCYAPTPDAGTLWTSARDHWDGCGLDDGGSE